MTRIAVLGATGYGGGELLRRLLRHPHATVAFATSRSAAGKPVASVHRNLEGFTELAFSAPSVEELAEGADVIIGAMPHAESAKVLAPFVDRGMRVIDLSGDFRLRDAALYRRWYGHDHPRADLLGAATYGCPELNREAIRASRFVAAPGCFATAMNLALLPAARAGILAGPATVTGLTGSSGSGAEAKEGTHHPTRAQTLRPYRPLSHQHVPEVLQLLGDAGCAPADLFFTPVSAPLVRGILVVASAPLARAVSAAEAAALYLETYSAAPFVHVLDTREPECATVATTNRAEVRARIAPDGSLHVLCAIDNLVKGGAGQGVQCLNLMMGWDERLGLDQPGTWP
jgi:N-acetyl-gamma-glutamyl-phosphate reductase